MVYTLQYTSAKVTYIIIMDYSNIDRRSSSNKKVVAVVGGGLVRLLFVIFTNMDIMLRAVSLQI